MPFLGEIFATSAALFWAIGVVLFKRSGEKMSPMALNLFKNTVAIVLYAFTMPLIGEAFIPPDQPLRVWCLLAVSGVLGISLADTLFFMSLERLGAGLTAVVDTSYTPIMLAMSFVVLGEDLGFEVLLGAVLIMGALLVGSATRPAPGKTRRDIVVGSVIGIAGIALMGVGVVMIKGVLSDVPHIWASSVRLLAGALGIVPMILLSPRRREIFGQLRPSPAWKVAIPASFFGTYLALTAWLGGMKYTDVSVATLLNQLSTIFIFILATIFLKESITWRRVIAIVLAFVGAVIVVWR